MEPYLLNLLLEVTPLPTALLCLRLLANISDNTRVDLTHHPGSTTLNLSNINIDHCNSIDSSVDNSDLNCSDNSFNPRLAIWNLGSVANQQAELEVFLKYHKIKLLVGTESHLNDSIYSSVFFLKTILCTEKIEIFTEEFLFWSINQYHHQS